MSGILPLAGDQLLDDYQPVQKMFKSRAHRIYWVTSEIVEGYDREFYLAVTSRELLLFVIFLLCATMGVIGKMDTSAYYMTAAIKTQIVGTGFYYHDFDTDFNDVRKFKVFHVYLTEYLAKRLYWTSFDKKTRVQYDTKKDRGVLYFNKLIGQPVMRQLAIGFDHCEVHPRFQKYNMTCIARYKNWNRLKEPRLPGCTAANNACTYKTCKETQAAGHTGKLVYYGCDGYQVKMGLDRKAFVKTAEDLKENSWYNKHTRVVFLDLMLFNPNMDLFCAVKLIFEFPPSGGIVPSYNFYTFQCLHAMNSNFEKFADGCLIVCLVFIVYYTVEKIREICFLKWQFFKRFWTYVDVLIIYFHIMVASYTIQVTTMATNLIPLMNENSADIENFSLQEMAHHDMLCRIFQGFGLFLIYMKLFKYFSLNFVTGQLNNTLKRSGWYLFYFSIIFILFLLAFAEFGYLVFGTEIREYCRIEVAMFTLITTILGDFTYEDLEKTHRHLAPIFFVLFIFMVFFILINMFLAIICGNYSAVKTDMAIAPEIMQMTEFWKKGFRNVCKALHCQCCVKLIPKAHDYNVPSEQIRYVLKRCGFIDPEIDVFMSRYNIQSTGDLEDISKVLEFLKTPLTEISSFLGENLPQTATKSSEAPVMALKDFNEQQKKLDEIETYINSIAERLDSLLRKMNALAAVKT